MGREILFRGKTESGEWVEGFYVCRSAPSPVQETDQEYEEHLIVNYGFDGMTECEVLPETVGEYVGIEDKNGKKIFEGMEVKDHNVLRGIVVFDNGCFFIKVLMSKRMNIDVGQLIPLFEIRHLEIVDNPELAKEGTL
jgi:hypothetical protein